VCFQWLLLLFGGEKCDWERLSGALGGEGGVEVESVGVWLGGWVRHHGFGRREPFVLDGYTGRRYFLATSSR